MKILIVHNKYSQLGGEDINIDREIKLLESEYVVESFIYKNLDQSLFNNVKSLAFNSNNSINEAFLKNSMNLNRILFMCIIRGLQST